MIPCLNCGKNTNKVVLVGVDPATAESFCPACVSKRVPPARKRAPKKVIKK